jgi:hypothetical protein
MNLGSFQTRWLPRVLGGCAMVTLLTGCDPTVNFYGSFFPAWVLSLGLGIVATILCRYLFAAVRLERNLGPLILVYPCLLLLLSCVAWIIFFKP